MFDSNNLFSTVWRIRLRRFACAALLIGGAAMLVVPPANAQKGTVITKSVRFAKGKSSAILKGTAQAYTSYAYTLRASEGQEMSVTVTSPDDNVYFSVFAPGGLGAFSGIEDITEWTDRLPKTGVYKIMVYSKSDVGASVYSLKISVK